MECRGSVKKRSPSLESPLFLKEHARICPPPAGWEKGQGDMETGGSA